MEVTVTCSMGLGRSVEADALVSLSLPEKARYTGRLRICGGFASGGADEEGFSHGKVEQKRRNY
jgi:hypothetical protein